MTSRELPVLGQGAPGPRRERADAARNRRRVLIAAAELFGRLEPAEITMEAIAKAAGVGRATVYRRYPDVASVAMALLDEHERGLQERILRGDPPLGPGAAPDERLAAFYEAMVDVLEHHAHLALGAEVGRSRFAPGAYAFWSTHVRILLEQAKVPDPLSLVDILLAPLAPEVYLHQRRVGGHTPQQIAAALTLVGRRVVGAEPP